MCLCRGEGQPWRIGGRRVTGGGKGKGGKQGF